MYYIRIICGKDSYVLPTRYKTYREAVHIGALATSKTSCAMWMNCDYTILDDKGNEVES